MPKGPKDWSPYGQRSLDELRVRIQKAIKEADVAFWAKIAAAFPEAVSGDFPPNASFKWNEAMEEAVYWWLRSNHPKPGWIDAIVRG